MAILMAFVSFIAGFVLFPLLYAAIPSIISEAGAKARFINSQAASTAISEKLKKQIEMALKPTAEVAWFNVLVQRIFTECTRNFAFEMRIRNAIMKSLLPAIKTGIIKNVRVLRIEFGKEAPYFKDFRIIRPDELKTLVTKEAAEPADLDCTELESMNFEEMLDDGGLDDGAPGGKEVGACSAAGLPGPLFRHQNLTVANIAESYSEHREGQNMVAGLGACHKREGRAERKASLEHLGFSTENASCVEFEESADSCLFSGATAARIYKQVTFATNVVYGGGFEVSLEIELPRKLYVHSVISIRGFEGEMLLRMPADNYETRYEYAFAKNPGFVIEVESGLGKEGKKPLFQSSISRFLKKAVAYSLRKMIVYPAWCQQLQGHLPSSRDVEHKIPRITPENIHITTDLAEKIMTYTSNDFKIVVLADRIYQRRSCHFVNGVERIMQFHFDVPKKIDGSVPGELHVFQGISVEESKLMNGLMDLQILGGVLANFRGLSVAYTKRSAALVTLRFASHSYEFVRIVYRNHLIFQRNDTLHPDFFVFGVSENVLRVFSCCNNPDYEFSLNRIRRLRAKIYGAAESLFGSGVLYKMIHRRRGAAGFTPVPNICEESTGHVQSMLGTDASEARDEEIGRGGCAIDRLEHVFQDALACNNEKLKSRAAARSSSREILLKCIKDDQTRMRLFSESALVRSKASKSEQIRMITLEDADMHSGLPGRTETSIIYSYIESDFIVDVSLEKNLTFIHRVERSDSEPGDAEPEYILRLIYRVDTDFEVPMYFLEALQLRVEHERILGITSALPQSLSAAKFSQEIKVQAGAAYFEFTSELEDDFQLTITSCKRGTPLLQIHKIISNRPFRLLIPTPNDFLKVSLRPKYKRNKFVQYRLGEVRLARDVYIDGNIGFSPNGKLVLPIKGFPTHVIFWEKSADSGIKGYLEDHESRNIIDGSGIMRADCRDYWLVYRNTENRKKRNVPVFMGMTYKK